MCHWGCLTGHIKFWRAKPQMVQNDWTIVLGIGIKGPDSDNSSEHQIEVGIEGPVLHSPRGIATSTEGLASSTDDQNRISTSLSAWEGKFGIYRGCEESYLKTYGPIGVDKVHIITKNIDCSNIFLLLSSTQCPGLVARKATFKL